MTLDLPRQIGSAHLDRLLEAFIAIRSSVPLRLDWQGVEEISPTGHAILACLADSLVEYKQQAESVFVKKKLRTIPIVRQVMESRALGKLPPASDRDQEMADSLLIGRNSVIDTQLIERFETKFAPYLSEETAFSCRLILNELMQNSVDHANAERYYLYGGITEGGARVHIGVLDMGVTIPAKLAQKYDLASDVEYLEHALKEGTSTRRQRPGGLGLFLAFEHLKEHSGTLTILSREAQIIRYFKHKRITRKKLKRVLHGTWCMAMFPGKERS